MVSLQDIRSAFLNYFEREGHKILPSSPLVPRNDPSLMFTNSGMVQFKNLFTGVETRDYKRAVTAQKCVRAGGKHNDLDNVGYTARHHTFFEMLGNFSFGDYFKSEAIPLAWNLITRDFGIPKDKLYVTVFHTDDEAADIWKKIGVPESRIIRISTSDNFWQMGPTGPCGPCSEIFYDHGEKIWGGPPGSPEEDGDRFIEIWNIVFMQNELQEDGSTKTLEMQSIDTGMGLERIAALLQGSHDNYDTDLMKGLIDASADLTSSEPFGPENVHHRVISDHLRSCSFLIADGVLPSNEGRGYVLRRIMRRAMRHIHHLGAKDPIMHRLVPELVTRMGQAYPELGISQALIKETLLSEETRFKAMLDRGLRILEDEIGALEPDAALPGATAFKLYDTYGFPLDLTQDALREKDRRVDTEGFDEAMAAQKAKARAAWVGSGSSADQAIWLGAADTYGPTEFLGYETETAEGQILAIFDQDQKEVAELSLGETGYVILNQTPFYAESGGQIGDSGSMITSDAKVEISDTKKISDLFLHIVKVTDGGLRKNAAKLLVDRERRGAIRMNHSATHLLHEALRQHLGEHVVQRGSLNADTRLRFDFSHQKPLSLEEIEYIERDVNHYIRQNTLVETRIMTPDDARALGAQALFGEKYGEEVRVVAMGRLEGSGKGQDGERFSLELCGGTHVARTGDIGAFVITGEAASASGIRRIEALTGQSALDHLNSQEQHLREIAQLLRAAPEDALARIKSLQDERKALQSEISSMRRQLAMGKDDDASRRAPEDINGIAVIARVMNGVSGKDLRAIIDEEKKVLGSGALILISNIGEKAVIAAGVTSDLTERLSAVDLVRAASEALGGKGGGGRPDFAQAGGPAAENADAGFKAAKAIIANL